MAQKNGLEAIGAMVCRHFGDDGYFVGIIISLNFSKDGNSLYRVKYSDEDMGDLDQEEYNYAYSLQLKRDGWTPLEEDDFGSDFNHPDNSQSTRAYKPAKVLHSFFVCFIALFIALFSLNTFELSLQDADDSDDDDNEPPPLQAVVDSDDEDDIPLASLLSPASKKASVFIAFVSCVFLF